MTLDAAAIARALERTTRAQSDAADPRASVWVSANAGTGKTHVLTNRVLRLMLAGTPPERILCLTYTKAAAAEMSKRVFDTLSRWVTMPDGELLATLSSLLVRAATAADAALARTLFTRAIETPGGLKVQTLHAFSERLLKRFPLEAGVPPGFAILDDDEAREVHKDAIDRTLDEATRDPAAPLGRALALVIAHAADDRFDELLKEAVRRRAWLDVASRMDLVTGAPPFAAAADHLRHALGVEAGATSAAIMAAKASVMSTAALVRAAGVLAAGKQTDQRTGAALAEAAKATDDMQRAAALAGAFLTKEGAARADKSFITKAVKDADPGLADALTAARDRYAVLDRDARAIAAVEATVALLTLADRAMQLISDAKRRRAALDFDDLIERTGHLLAGSPSAEWVLYKLDGGLDHILVDESQDTAPRQWRIVEALAREFFTGSGARDEQRTLFAVGDEKQSIYSFQGAAPDMFAAMGRRFEAMAKSAGQTWREVPLDLSFRSVAPVLDAVDAVFADPRRTPGLTSGGTDIAHIARRFDQGGLVEIWPLEPFEDAAAADAFDPLAETPVASPVTRLAARIAATIRGWLDTGEVIASTGRPIRPGDILVLLRKRQPLAGPIVAALKSAGIPVAGADRMRLLDQIAVKDLVALADFLTLPEDDLSLAAVLKSPLFDLTDDDLMEIARGRRGTLWQALLAHAADRPDLAAAADRLKRWRGRADYVPPYEFLAHLLDKDGARAKLLARLGPDAADAIDELLNLAIRYDDAAPPSLSGFLAFLREGTREVKRDMEHGRDEVRVMTVHGAKGLEAPIVFLPDTTTTRSAGGSASALVPLAAEAGDTGDDDVAPWLWTVAGAASLGPVTVAKDGIADAETAERNRLLYVALTRARDRLYIAGTEGKRGMAAGCWYELVLAGLEGRLMDAEVPGHGMVRRLASPQSGPTERPRHEASAALAPVPPPAWTRTPPPREPQLAVPLAPSSLAPFETDDSGEPKPAAARDAAGDEPAAPSPIAARDAAAAAAGEASDARFLRGTLTHALLEHLPSLPPATWAKAARAFVAARGGVLSRRARDSIAAEALAILADPVYAPIFAAGSRAEVPIVAEIPRPSGAGPALRLNGQIDRLAVTDHEVLIVDYKTNRTPPAAAEGVADTYLFQLAAYRLALRRIFPHKTVRAALLWTDGPRLMDIPSSLLDNVETRLWTLDPGRLEG